MQLARQLNASLEAPGNEGASNPCLSKMLMPYGYQYSYPEALVEWKQDLKHPTLLENKGSASLGSLPSTLRRSSEALSSMENFS